MAVRLQYNVSKLIKYWCAISFSFFPFIFFFIIFLCSFFSVRALFSFYNLVEIDCGFSRRVASVSTILFFHSCLNKLFLFFNNRLPFYSRSCVMNQSFIKSILRRQQNSCLGWKYICSHGVLSDLVVLQVNLFQKHLFLQQLTHNMTKDCLLIYQFSTWKLQAQNMRRTCCVHKLFWM